MQLGGFLLLFSLAFKGYLASTVGKDFICDNRQVLKDHTHTFKYVGIVENGIQGTSNEITKLRIRAIVEISNLELGECLYHLKFKTVKVSHALGEHSKYGKVHGVESLTKRLIKYPLSFTMKNGVVQELRPSVNSRKVDVLNIQRGLLSVFQVRGPSHTGIVKEKDVSGDCLVTYSTQERSDDIVVQKTKDVNSCEGHQITHSNIVGNPFVLNGDEKESSLLDSSSGCQFILKDDGLKHAACNETFLIKAFSTEQKAGAYAKSRSILVLKEVKNTGPTYNTYNSDYYTKIMYDHNHQHTPAKIKSTGRVQSLLNDLAEHDFHVSNYFTAQKFYDFVASLRQLNLKSCTAFVKSVDLQRTSFRTYLLDGLAQCGTHECIRVLFDLLQEKRSLQNEAYRFIPYLAFIAEPSPEIIYLVKDIHQKSKDPSMLLAFTNLVSKLCIHRQKECTSYSLIGKVARDIENYLLQMLGNNCQVKDVEKLSDIYYALIGLGNIGTSVKAIPLIMDCVTNAPHLNISVAAIQSLRKMHLPRKTVSELRSIFAEVSADLEKRVEIFLSIMRAPTRGDIILARDIANNLEESAQMRSFIVSYLNSALVNTDPTKTKVTELFQKTLKEFPLDNFDPPSYQYSKAFQKSFHLSRSTAAVEGMAVYHPESFIPRTLRANLTTRMLGYSVNVLEVSARMEGLEPLLTKYLGPGVGEKYVEQFFKVPDLPKSRRKRRQTSPFDNIDSMVNMKNAEPQTVISMKIFGNNVQQFDLRDIPLLNGKMDNLNLVQVLYELSKGAQYTYKQNMVLLEASHSVPTVVGLPLKIAINGSSVVTFDVKGSVQTKNILYGPKMATIYGSLQPSVSTHVSGKLNVECFGYAEVGTSFQANLHAGKKIHGRIEYREGEQLKLDMNAEKQINDVFNVSYNMYHVLSDKIQEMEGIDKKIKGDFCLNDIFNSTEVFGSDTCVDVQFPNAYYNRTVPYFPLTGSAHIGVRNFPRDPLLTKYRLVIKRRGDLYDFAMSTPGASAERHYSMGLGLTRNQDNGIVALSFGQERRGASFQYKFDKETNDVETKFTCNFTKIPFSLLTQYYNVTHPDTLNREIGERIVFKLADIYRFKQSAVYYNTYDAWHFKSHLEYAPNKTVDVNLRIQYEPQLFTVSLSHPTTKTSLEGYLSPSFPLVVGRLNVTHGENVDMRGWGKIDIQKYMADGAVNASGHKVSAFAVWKPNEKLVKVKGDVNGAPVIWNASLHQVAGDNKLVSSLQVSQLSIDIVHLWNSRTMDLDVAVAKQRVFRTLGDISQQDNRIKLSLETLLQGKLSKAWISVTNGSATQEVCLEGVLTGKNFGYCFQVKKNTVLLKMLMSKTDMWKNAVEFSRSKTSNQSAASLSVLDQFKLSYQLSEKKFLISTQVLQSLTSFQKDLTDKADVTKASFKWTDSYKLNIAHTSPIDPTKAKKWEGSVSSGKSTVSSTVTHGKQGSTIRTSFVDKASATQMLFVRNFNGKIFDMESNGTFYRLKTISNNQILIQTRESKFSGYKEFLHLQINADDSARFRVNTQNPVLKQLLKRNLANREHATRMLSSIYQQLMTKILTELQVEAKDATEITDAVKNSLIMYASNLTCNGDRVYKQHLEGVLTKDTVSDIILKILYLPYSSSARNFYANSSLLDPTSKQMLAGITENPIHSILASFHVVIKTLRKHIHDPQVNKFIGLGMVELSNDAFFDDEFFKHLDKIVHLLRKSFELDQNKLNEKIDKISSKLPKKLKAKFSSTIKNIVNMLKEFKYDHTKTAMKNANSLLQKLEESGILDVILLDYDYIIVKSVMSSVNIDTSLKSALNSFIEDNNYTELVKSILLYGLRRLKVDGDLQARVHKLIESTTFDEFMETLAKYVTQHSNADLNIKQGFEEYLKTKNPTAIRNELVKVLREYKIPESAIRVVEKSIELKDFTKISELLSKPYLPGLVKRMFDNFGTSDSIVQLLSAFFKDDNKFLLLAKDLLSEKVSIPAKLLKIYKSLASLHTPVKESSVEILTDKFFELLFADEKDFGVVLKSMTLSYYNDWRKMFNKKVPSEWSKRLADLIHTIELRLKNVNTNALRKNATNEIAKIASLVYDDVSSFADTKLPGYLQKGWQIYFEKLLSQFMIGEETGLEFFKRSQSELNEKLLFVIRLLGQFSETNSFRRRFVADGKVQFFKIYKSLWQDNVTNKANLRQINELLDGMEQRTLRELNKFTSNYTLVSTLNNALHYVRSLNYSDFNALIDSYSQLDVSKFENLTYAALIEYGVLFLRDMGEIRDGDRSVDEIVFGKLPLVRKRMQGVHFKIKKALTEQIGRIQMAKLFTRKVFHTAEKHLSRPDQNKFVQLLLELLVPGIDEAISHVLDKNTEFWSKSNEQRCSEVFLSRFSNQNVSAAVSQVWIADFANSSSCDMINFFADVRAMPKDRRFVQRIVHHVSEIVNKMLDEKIHGYNTYISKSDLVLQKSLSLPLKSSRHALEKSVSSITSKIFEALQDVMAYKQLSRVVRRSVSIQDLDLRAFIRKHITRQLQQISPQISTKRINSLARRYIPYAVNILRQHLQNTTLLILRGVDTVKAPLAGKPFLVKPFAFFKKLPSTVMLRLRSLMRQNRNEIYKNLYLIESELRDLFKKSKIEIEKYHKLSNETISKMKLSVKEYGDQVSKIVHKHKEKYDKELKMLSLVEEKNYKISDRLDRLSEYTIKMKKKVLDMRKDFLKELSENLTMSLEKNSFMENADLKNVLKEKNILAFKQLFTYVQMDLRKVTNKLIYPQLVFVARHIDNATCHLKRNISKFYSVDDNMHTLTVKQAGLAAYINSMQKLDDHYTNLLVSKLTSPRKQASFAAINNVAVKKVDPVTSLVYVAFSQKVTNCTNTALRYYKIAKPYIDRTPDDVAKEAFTKYQLYIKRLALRMKKALVIVPPKNLEAPVVRFIGYAFGQEKTALFKPISRTAYLFNNSIVTFDGKFVLIPPAERSCLFILTRDFARKTFTVYMQDHRLFVQLPDVIVSIGMRGSKQISAQYIGGGETKELPIQLTYTKVTRPQPNVVKIESKVGLLVLCRVDHFSCNVTVAGYFHNKTLGLFGTNNVERADDFRTPDGRLALNLHAFVKSFQLLPSCSLTQDYMKPLRNSIRSNSQKCQRMYTNITRSQSVHIRQLKSSFQVACSVDETCAVARAFVQRSKDELYQPTSLPKHCHSCPSPPRNIRLMDEPRRHVHITFLFKLNTHVAEVTNSLLHVVRRLESEKNEVTFAYSVVGFAGRELRKRPHLQTGDGLVIMTRKQLAKALKQLKFDGGFDEHKYGLSAVKFASELDLTSSLQSRILVLFDNDVTYTNSLLEMSHVYKSMQRKGVVLNVVNNYKLKRNVIGKDSIGMKYYTRLPLGEHHRSLRFPPPDDYTPLVQQSKGGVFALHAFTTKDAVWAKSTPVSIARSLGLQIESDSKRCKECKCTTCRNVNQEVCQYGL